MQATGIQWILTTKCQWMDGYRSAEFAWCDRLLGGSQTIAKRPSNESDWWTLAFDWQTARFGNVHRFCAFYINLVHHFFYSNSFSTRSFSTIAKPPPCRNLFVASCNTLAAFWWPIVQCDVLGIHSTYFEVSHAIPLALSVQFSKRFEFQSFRARILLRVWPIDGQ